MTWLTDKIKLYAACAAAALLLGAVILVGSYWLGAKASLKAETQAHAVTKGERDKANQDLGACRTNVANLNAAVVEQNRAVEAWKQAALDQERRADEAVQRARTQAARLRSEVIDLSRLQPAPGEDRCKAAELLLRGTLGAGQ